MQKIYFIEFLVIPIKHSSDIGLLLQSGLVWPKLKINTENSDIRYFLTIIDKSVIQLAQKYLTWRQYKLWSQNSE